MNDRWTDAALGIAAGTRNELAAVLAGLAAAQAILNAYGIEVCAEAAA